MLKILIVFTTALGLAVCLIISTKSRSQITNSSVIISTKVSPTPTILNEWKVVPIPTKQQRQCANWAEDEREVLLENGVIKVSKYVDNDAKEIPKLPIKLQKFITSKGNIGNGLAGYLHIEPFDDGWLIGSDAGEWGGRLSWFSVDGKQIRILEDNIRGIAKVGNETLILTGLAHLSLDKGKIYRLIKDENRTFSTKLFTNLKTQPQNFIIENNESIVVSLKDKIIRVKLSGEIQKLIDFDLSQLYPNSMILTNSGEIYLGMRMFVVRVKPTENGFIQEWLLPKDCGKIVEDTKNITCVCEK